MSAIEAERACGSSVRELCAALNLRDPEGQRTAVQIVRTLFSIARAATCASPSSDVCCTPTPVDAGALGLHVPSANMPASLPAAVAALRSRMQRWRAALERPHELPACCVHDLTHVTDLATRLLACTPTEEAAFPQRATLTRVPESVFIAAPTQPARPLRRRLRIAPDAVQVQPVLPSFAASFVACMLHVCCEASAGSPDTALIVRLLHTALRAFNRAQAVSAHDLHALPWLLAYFALDAAAESSMHATQRKVLRPDPAAATCRASRPGGE
ncbi:MAG: hypothetical protein EOO65_04685 [Methanosarcinales archaeon]|nr:MAG: hypothetical protein EOO65_04685 [Methanosarcinales archaeon]